MAKFDGAHHRGDVMRRLEELRREVQRLGTARALAATTITDGSVVVKNGGGVEIQDGGAFTAFYPTGRIAVQVGPIRQNGNVVFDGMLIQVDEEPPNDLLRVGQDPGGPTGSGFLLGTSDKRAGSFGVVVDQAIVDTSETTTNAANVHLDPVDFHLRLVTSAADAKLHVRDLDMTPDDALLLHSRVWLDRGEVDRGVEARPVVGFVAEEVAAVPGLEPLVQRDADGSPVGVAYDRVPAVQQVVLRDHEARIADLETRLAAALARLDALEADRG